MAVVKSILITNVATTRNLGSHKNEKLHKIIQNCFFYEDIFV